MYYIGEGEGFERSVEKPFTFASQLPLPPLANRFFLQSIIHQSLRQPLIIHQKLLLLRRRPQIFSIGTFFAASANCVGTLQPIVHWPWTK